MATITFDQATRIYPRATAAAVDGLDLEIDGEFLVLVRYRPQYGSSVRCRPSRGRGSEFRTERLARWLVLVLGDRFAG